MVDVEDRFVKLKRLVELFMNFVANTTKSKAETAFTESDCTSRMQLLEDYWKKFTLYDDEVASQSEKMKDRTYFKEDLYGHGLNAYLAAKSWLSDKLQTLRPPPANLRPNNSSTPSMYTVQSQLEKVKLPRFDGKQRSWEAFKEKFKSLILDDRALPNVIKFQHLLNSLEGEAAEKLKGVEVIAANFETAWQTLCRRYDNRFLRFSTHMNALSSLPAATKETVAHLNRLLNTANEGINASNSLSLLVDHWDVVIIHFLESKLASTTRIDWVKEIEKTRADPPDAFSKFAEFKAFLEDRIRTLDLVEGEAVSGDSKITNADQKRGQNFNNKPKKSVMNVTTQKTGKPRGRDKCTFCSGEHFIGYCKKFSECSQVQRREHAATARLCFNCLSPSHIVDNCSSKGRCMVCNEKHHTKLHLEKSATHSGSTKSNDAKFVAVTTTPDVRQSSIGTSRSVTLATACVVLEAESGATVTVRALLDPCAEECIVTERVAQLLSLKKQKADVAVCGVGESAAIAKHRVNLSLKSSRDSNFSLDFSAITLKRLSTVIPKTEVHWQDWPHLQGLELADPAFGKPGRIDCILHAGVYAAVMLPEFKRIADLNAPLAMRSVFGWVVIGHTGAVADSQRDAVQAYSITIDHELSKAVSRFWETEEIQPSAAERLSPAEQDCYQRFKDTHTRNCVGRFVVRLPFISPPKLSGTEERARRSYLRMEKRFRKSSELADAYTRFINEYLDLKHAEAVPDDEVTSTSISVISHLPVFKNDESKKIRVVFYPEEDENNSSLNSFLHVGPKLQEDVSVILTRWRFYRFVFSCDIVKMFRQFLVHPDDVDWQRILWRFHEDQPIKTLRLLTVTYGTTSAPFLANACLQQLADNEEKRFPLGAQALRQNRYVDDSFAGDDTLAEALEIRTQLIDSLASAGMQVGKWAANHPVLLQNLISGEDFISEREFQETEAVSTLGLRWSPANDAFFFKVSTPNSSDIITKKSVLSEIAKLFDPAGWLAPIIICTKIFMQKLWLIGVAWDEPLPASLRNSWLTLKDSLQDIETISIPRWFETFKTDSWTLHGFCDPSERAFAAAIYIVRPSENSCSSMLIAAKIKVAPVKTLSIPKLELSGAVLLIKLISYFISKLIFEPSRIVCWTDSQVVLPWIQSHPSRWKPFVANRVSEIITSLPQASWRYVRSQDNPADVASRGCTPTELRELNIWWYGPAWLKSDEVEWPASKIPVTNIDLEARKGALVTDIFAISKIDAEPSWFENYSSFDKLVGIISYILRWRNNAKVPDVERNKSFLSASELSAGRAVMLRLMQSKSFPQELADLSSKGHVAASSPLRRLTPFLDVDGLIRVGGRLQNSFLSESEKHPIILPGKHHVTKLLIQTTHRITLHGGPLLVQSVINRQYWIIHGRNLIRSIVRQCIKCARFNATTQEQLMGSLPAARTRPSRPFTYTGLDYAGPFWIKASPGRGRKITKGYVAIFVCMAVKATHLEVVSDLTTSAFLAAFYRFVSRRGLCHTIYSDNATNFRGADSELRRLFSETSSLSQEVAAVIANHGVTLSFIPPQAPNFVGLWEANVRSFKRHLQRVVGDEKLTVEEFMTVATKIEACLNSRPLCALSSNEEDVSALTPGHFLIGAPLVSPAEFFQETNENNSICSRWYLLSCMRNFFWKRWSKEYLSQAQQRVKWFRPNNQLQVEDLVLYRDDLLPPTKWPLARITALHPRADGLARVATMRTSTADYKHPVNRLILLPVDETATTQLREHKKTK